jgi:hypothetical protein
MAAPEPRVDAGNRVFAFCDLCTADLFIDAVYEGGTNKNVTDDPLDPLMGCGNQGGFPRYRPSECTEAGNPLFER